LTNAIFIVLSSSGLHQFPFSWRRFHGDLGTTVSDYVTQKTRRDFPMVADRVATTYNGSDAVEFSRDRDYQATSGREEKRIMYAGVVSRSSGGGVPTGAQATAMKMRNF
jgi:hypothetical protein